MINILSLNCSLAFAPYLSETVAGFLARGPDVAKSIRQGGTGLLIRSQDRLAIRHQNRETLLDREAARHYLATVEFRIAAYDLVRTSDEIVLGSLEGKVFLSHPQSDLWLDRQTVERLLSAAKQSSVDIDQAGLPDWLSVSTGGGRLLISDQRNGRWVLLGSDHIAELERRLGLLQIDGSPGTARKPPVILLKGAIVHLHSARRLLQTLHEFHSTGNVSSFEDVAPHFSLRVSQSSQGLELDDSNVRVGIAQREARKWAAIVEAELVRLNATEVERGMMRTVIADEGGGRWVIQCGDEVFVPSEQLSSLLKAGSPSPFEGNARPFVGELHGFVILLAPSNSACVALTPAELKEVNTRELGYQLR